MFRLFRWIVALVVLAFSGATALATQTDVVIQDTGAGGVTLLGTLTLADGKGLEDGAVLITHGTLAHHRMELVAALQTALAERGISSLAHTLSLGVDRRTGMYDCAVPFDGTFEDSIREIGLWRQWLLDQGAPAVVMLGHSRGALQSLTAAATTDNGVAGAVLMAPPPSGGSVAARAQAYRQRYGADLVPILQHAETLVAAGKGGEMIKVPGFASCPGTSASARSIASTYGDNPERNVRAQLARLKSPALIIAAGKDRVVGNLAAAFGDIVDGEKVRLSVIDDADHMFLDFYSEDAADLIAAFAGEMLAVKKAAMTEPGAGDWPIIDLEVTEVLPGYVYSAIGETFPPSYENSGHNNNLSFIITGEGVVVVNGGGTNLLARSLHAEIRALTDQPVKYVIIENGQGHAFLGTSYWAAQGVPVIAHTAARYEIVEHGHVILDTAKAMLKERIQDTTVHEPEIVFDDSYELQIGGKRIVALTFGPAHAAGDTSVWLPDDSLILTGDLAFHERLLGVFPETVTKDWIASFEKMEALQPKYVIPGHGGPTNLAEVTKYTKGYLQYLRSEVQKILDNDGGLMDAYKIDQSAYAHLDTFEELAVKNASRVYAEMELELF